MARSNGATQPAETVPDTFFVSMLPEPDPIWNILAFSLNNPIDKIWRLLEFSLNNPIEAALLEFRSLGRESIRRVYKMDESERRELLLQYENPGNSLAV